MNPALIADKYIARDGSVPSPDLKAKSEPDEIRVSIKDILTVANFIGWQDPNEVWGGVKGQEAFEAFSRILAMEPEALMKIVRLT